MKNSVTCILLAFVATFMFSCTKTIEIITPSHHHVVYTDNPPNTAALFPYGTVYGQITLCYLSKETIDSSIDRGWACSGYFDNNTGNWISYDDCGPWNLSSARAYWGEVIQGGDTTLYIGAAVLWYAISPNDFVTTSKYIRSNGQSIAQISHDNYYYYYNNNYSYLNNPIGATNGRLVGIRPR